MSFFFVSRRDSGRMLWQVLGHRLRLPKQAAIQAIRQRRVLLNNAPCRLPNCRVREGQRLSVLELSPKHPPTNSTDLKICHVDPHIVVVDKPAGLTTVRQRREAAEFGQRGRRFLPPTLADVLTTLLIRGKSQPGSVRAVHRLDKETSGLVVFARNLAAERNLGKQFRAHSIERCYVAIVRGRAQPGRIESYLVDDRGDSRRGSTPEPGKGKRAITNVKVLEALGQYSVVECRLETGRTHQVRIHLGERGTPICGERVYDRPIHGKPVADNSGAPRLALHAARLGFNHPVTGKKMTWDSSLPKDLQDLLNRLRRSKKSH
jgi:23S rRNA pseudouridine1911/1915/1917 synthase